MPRQTEAMKAEGAGKRYPLNMRTTKAIRKRLESAAARNGRSLAQEVEFRLETSFMPTNHRSDGPSGERTVPTEDVRLTKPDGEGGFAFSDELSRTLREGATGRFISPHKPPEGYERELLEILAEECAEVIQRVTKALRFGLDEVQPGQPLTNLQRISSEMGDCATVMGRMNDAGIFDPDAYTEGSRNKKRQLDRFLQHLPTVRGK